MASTGVEDEVFATVVVVTDACGDVGDTVEVVSKDLASTLALALAAISLISVVSGTSLKIN